MHRKYFPILQNVVYYLSCVYAFLIRNIVSSACPGLCPNQYEDSSHWTGHHHYGPKGTGQCLYDRALKHRTPVARQFNHKTHWGQVENQLHTPIHSCHRARILCLQTRNNSVGYWAGCSGEMLF